MDVPGFRELAEKWRFPDAGRWTEEEWGSALKDAAELERRSLSELRKMAKGYGIGATSRMEKGALVMTLLKAEFLGAKRVGELRRLAKGEGIEYVQRLKKPELIRALLRREGSAPEETISKTEPESRDHISLRSMRLLGCTIRLASGMGLAVCLIGAVLLPFATTRVVAFSEDFLHRVGEQARTLKTSLEHVYSSLESANKVLDSTAGTLAAAGQSMEGSVPLIESVSVLVGGQAPTTIETTRLALIAAEDGAGAIDQVLRGLAKLSLLTGVTYDPKQSLDQSLAQIAHGLEPLPPGLITVGEDIGELADDIDHLGQDLLEMPSQLEAFSGEIVALQDELQGFILQLDESARVFDGACERVSTWIWVTFVLLELGLIWLGLGQCAVYYVGGQIRGGA
jgi:hypothetical protein